MPLRGLAEGFWGSIDEQRQQQRQDDYRRQQLEGSILTHLANSDDPEIASRAWAGLLDSTNPKAKRKGLGAFLGETEANPALPKLREFLSQPKTVTETHQREPEVRPGGGADLQMPAVGPDGPLVGATAQQFGPPPAPTTEQVTHQEPRKVFMMPEEREVTGAIAGWRAAGLSEHDAQLQVQAERARRYGLGLGGLHGGSPLSYQKGVVEMPDGTQRYAGFNPRDNKWYDNDTGLPLEGARPPTHSAVRSYGTAVEMATRQLFPGKSYGMLTPEEAQQAAEYAKNYAVDTAGDRARRVGDEGVITKLKDPTSITESAATGIPIGTPLGSVAGQTAATPAQRDAANVADMILPVLSNDNPADPGILELSAQVLPTAAEASLAGFNTAGAMVAYRRSRTEYQPLFAALDSKVALIQGQIRKLQGQGGAETEKDAERALSTIANIQGGWIKGDTRESQAARIEVLRGYIERMRDVVRRKQTVTGPAGAPPPGPAAAAAPSAVGAPPPGMPAIGTPGVTAAGRRYTVAGYTPDGKIIPKYDDAAQPAAAAPPPR